jgi:anti-sigma regulatory factor (Ser/Thr protein kinase)
MKEISLHIMDLLQNSIRAEASIIQIVVEEQVNENQLKIVIEDNGHGMSPDILKRAMDPFFTSRTTRKVGLGISLFKQLVEQCNGDLAITSEEGKGTRLMAHMDLNHIDRQPMGDIAGVMVLLFSANPEIRFMYSHETEKGKYEVDTLEIKDILGEIPVYSPDIIHFLKEMIQENLTEINVQN